MKIWIGASNPPRGSDFIKDTAVHGLSVAGDADFLSVEYDVGEPGITGLDVLQTLYRGTFGMVKSKTIGIHESDPERRAELVKFVKAILTDWHNDKCAVSEDGGISYHYV